MAYRVLWIADSPELPTGFARATREILKRLAQKGIEMHAVAVGSRASTFPSAECGFTVWPHPPATVVGETVERITQALQPDAVVTLCDLWTPSYMPGVELAR